MFDSVASVLSFISSLLGILTFITTYVKLEKPKDKVPTGQIQSNESDERKRIIAFVGLFVAIAGILFFIGTNITTTVGYAPYVERPDPRPGVVSKGDSTKPSKDTALKQLTDSEKVQISRREEEIGVDSVQVISDEDKRYKRHQFFRLRNIDTITHKEIKTIELPPSAGTGKIVFRFLSSFGTITIDDEDRVLGEVENITSNSNSARKKLVVEISEGLHTLTIRDSHCFELIQNSIVEPGKFYRYDIVRSNQFAQGCGRVAFTSKNPRLKWRVYISDTVYGTTMNKIIGDSVKSEEHQLYKDLLPKSYNYRAEIIGPKREFGENVHTGYFEVHEGCLTWVPAFE